MNEFRYEMLSLDNVTKYSNFFKEEIKIAKIKGNIIEEGSDPWLIERNSVKYMTKILNGNQEEKSFKRKNGEKVTPLFQNNFTQLVLEKISGKVVAIIDAREYSEESKKLNFLEIRWILVKEKFTKKGIASKLYSNLEKFGRENSKIYFIHSSAIKKNKASCNLHLKNGYKLEENEKNDGYYDYRLKVK